jgi:NitT/TauT family transport system substrate-binding protein
MVFVDDDIGRLRRGEVDLMQGYATEELVRLRRQAGPGAGFISFRALGFDAYSQVVFMTAAQLRDHGEAGRAFVRGLRAGWTYAAAHPEEAVAAVQRRLAPGADRGLLAEMLAATFPYVAAPGAPALAPMAAAKWSSMSAAAVEMGLLPRAEDPAAFLAAPPP